MSEMLEFKHKEASFNVRIQERLFIGRRFGKLSGVIELRCLQFRQLFILFGSIDNLRCGIKAFEECVDGLRRTQRRSKQLL